MKLFGRSTQPTCQAAQALATLASAREASRQNAVRDIRELGMAAGMSAATIAQAVGYVNAGDWASAIRLVRG